MKEHTVAIVDDDPSVRNALARLLTIVGHRPVLFASAAEFLSAASTTQATCVLIDINLGNTFGLDLAREISAAGLKFPVIFMSSSDDNEIREQCLDFGCVAYLRKPFSESQLFQAIANAASKPSAV